MRIGQPVLFLSFIEIEIDGEVALGVEGDGFAHEGLGDVEVFGKLPDLGAAAGDGVGEILGGDELADGPFVGAVFMLQSQCKRSMLRIKGTCAAVSELVGKLDRFIGGTRQLKRVDRDMAGAVLVDDGKALLLFHGKTIHIYAVFLGFIIQLEQVHLSFFFSFKNWA